MEEVKKNVLNIEEIKAEISKVNLTDDMKGIKEHDIIKKLFEDNYNTILNYGDNYAFFRDSFPKDGDLYAPAKVSLLNKLFDKVEKDMKNKTKNNEAGDPILPGQGGNVSAKAEEKSEQKDSTNAQAVQSLPGQSESSNAQKQQQTLNPVNQNTATMIDIKSEKEQLEELKNTLLQTASKTMLEMQTKMGLCNLLNEQCEMLVNQNNVLRQNFNNLKEEKEFVVSLVKSTNTLLDAVNDGTKEHNLAIVNQINRREQSTGMRVELYENKLPEQLTFESLINNFKQNNEQSMNELKSLDGATVNFDTLALTYEERKKCLSSIK